METSSVLLLGAALVFAAAAAFAACCAVSSAVSEQGGARLCLHSAQLLVKRAIGQLAVGGERIVGAIPWLRGVMRKRRLEQKQREIRTEMPKAIRLLCISLESGASVAYALQFAANGCSGALAEELKHAVWDLEAGLGFDEAMENLRLRTEGSAFSFLAVAMEIQHVSGGSLSDVLQSVNVVLQQESELEDLLATKTSQGQLSSKVLIAMPLVLLGVLTVFSPGYLQSFFTSALGVVLFVAALAMEAAGIMLTRRCLKVDLSANVGALS